MEMSKMEITSHGDVRIVRNDRLVGFYNEDDVILRSWTLRWAGLLVYTKEKGVRFSIHESLFCV